MEKIIEVDCFEEATRYASDILINQSIELDLEMNIALTGGRFGLHLVKNLNFSDLHTQRLNIFQTDERFVPPTGNDSNQFALMSEIIKFNSDINYETFFFDTNLSAIESMINMKETLERKRIDSFDCVFLSLGEDGHLAGDFHTSDYHFGKFSWTEQSPKPPKKRISFSASWLAKSKITILAIFGNEKTSALRKFLSKDGMHSSILESSNLVILKDKKIII